MKLIDNNGKLFGKINIIDFGIVFIIILVALAAYIKFGVLNQTSTSTELTSVHYTIEISGIRNYSIENLYGGDTVYETGGSAIGTVVGIETEEYEMSLEMLDGTITTAVVPDRYTMTIEIEADAMITDGRYYIDKTYEIGAGSSKTINTKYIQGSGTVKEIWVNE